MKKEAIIFLVVGVVIGALIGYGSTMTGNFIMHTQSPNYYKSFADVYQEIGTIQREGIFSGERIANNLKIDRLALEAMNTYCSETNKTCRLAIGTYEVMENNGVPVENTPIFFQGGVMIKNNDGSWRMPTTAEHAAFKAILNPLLKANGVLNNDAVVQCYPEPESEHDSNLIMGKEWGNIEAKDQPIEGTTAFNMNINSQTTYEAESVAKSSQNIYSVLKTAETLGISPSSVHFITLVGGQELKMSVVVLNENGSINLEDTNTLYNGLRSDVQALVYGPGVYTDTLNSFTNSGTLN